MTTKPGAASFGNTARKPKTIGWRAAAVAAGATNPLFASHCARIDVMGIERHAKAARPNGNTTAASTR